MSEPAAFLIYAGLFRLAIVAAGALSIWLGYRLFTTMTSHAGAGAGSGTDAEARIGDARVSLRRAAPGTCFAAFGAAVIAVMLAKDMPALSQREAEGAGTVERSMAMKGAPDRAGGARRAFAQDMARADARLRDGDNAGAASAYARALRHPELPLGAAARTFNQLAWLHHLDGDHATAVALARIAVGLTPENPAYLDTLAQSEAAMRDARTPGGPPERRAGEP